MSVKWSKEDILRFLDIYEKYDVLWNTHSPQYRGKSSRELALQNIIQELNMENLTPDIIRNKIKMIKTVYTQERNKILKSQESGSLYIPKLAWFEKADHFLRDVSLVRTNHLEKGTEDDFEETEAQEDFKEETTTPQKTTNKMPIKKQLLTNVSSKINKNHIRKPNFDVVNVIDKLHHIADNNGKSEDEFDHFGKFIASQLRQLPVVNALHCQEQILSVITQERMSAIQQADIEGSSSIIGF